MERKVDAFEMFIYRQMLKISWCDWVTNVDVSDVRRVFTQDKRRKSRKSLLFYLTNELCTYTYISRSIGLPSLTIFYFSLKMNLEKGLAVKLQVLTLSMSTPLPNVKQLNSRKKKTTISDTWYSDRFWSGLPVWSSKNPCNFVKKSVEKTFNII